MAQDYLYDDIEPPEEASAIPTPFSPVTEITPGIGLRALTGQPWLRDATFSFRPRFYYRSVRNGLGVQDTFAGGGALGLTTGWWRDIVQVGVTGYTTQPLVAVRDNNRSGLVRSDGSGFFTLGEAWLRLRGGPATATLYRQTLNLPFINMNDARIIPNTFEAYQVEVRAGERLRFQTGYITQMKPRDSPDFKPMSEIAGAPQVDRGTAFAGLIAEPLERATLGAITQVTWDLFCSTYVQGGYTWQPTPGLEVRGDLQFADQRSVGGAYLGDFNTQLYGGRISASYGGALASLIYTQTARGSDLLNPFGADPAFNMLMISDFALAGEQSIGGGLSYHFARIGLDGLTIFTHAVHGALPAGAWEREINATIDYRFQMGILQNLWLRLRYAHNERSFGAPVEDFRVIVNYAITF